MPRHAPWFALLVLVGCASRGVPVDVAPPTTSAVAADDATSMMKRAYDLHFEDGAFDAAIDAYGEVAARHPFSPQAPEALFRIANVRHWEMVEPTGAIAAYERVIATYPASEYAVESIVRIGECHTRLGDPKAAVQRFDDALRGHLDSVHVPLAMLTKARTLQHDIHDRDAAKAVYERLRDEYPDTKYGREARLWLVDLRPKSSDRDVRRADEATRLAEYRAIQAEASDYQLRATAQYKIAFSHYLLDELQYAIREAKALLTDYPDTYDNQLARTYSFIGSMYARLYAHDETIKWTEEGLAKYPKSLSAGRLSATLTRARREKRGRASGPSPADETPRVIEDVGEYIAELVRLERIVNEEPRMVDDHVEETWQADRQLYTPAWRRLDDHLEAGGGRRPLFEAAAALVDSPDADTRYVGLRIVVTVGGQHGRNASETWRQEALTILRQAAADEGSGRALKLVASALTWLDAPEDNPVLPGSDDQHGHEDRARRAP